MTTNRMGLEQMLSDERLEDLAKGQYFFARGAYEEAQAMARELLAYRKASKKAVADVVAWNKPGEERKCDIRWRRFDVAPGPLFTVPPSQAVTTPDDVKLLQTDVTIWKDRCEALQELFKEVADALDCDVKDNEAMLSKITQLQAVTVPDGWVKCSERMPEDGVNVIAYFGGDDEPFVDHDVYFHNVKFYWPEYQPGNYENEIAQGRITHWMPLPAPHAEKCHK